MPPSEHSFGPDKWIFCIFRGQTFPQQHPCDLSPGSWWHSAHHFSDVILKAQRRKAWAGAGTPSQSLSSKRRDAAAGGQKSVLPQGSPQPASVLHMETGTVHFSHRVSPVTAVPQVVQSTFKILIVRMTSELYCKHLRKQLLSLFWSLTQKENAKNNCK